MDHPLPVVVLCKQHWFSMTKRKHDDSDSDEPVRLNFQMLSMPTQRADAGSGRRQL